MSVDESVVQPFELGERGGSEFLLEREEFRFTDPERPYNIRIGDAYVYSGYNLSVSELLSIRDWINVELEVT